MRNTASDPRCPECGEPIGQTATYCMHCSADLTEAREAADTDDDGVWDQTGAGSIATRNPAGSADGTRRGFAGIVTKLARAISHGVRSATAASGQETQAATETSPSTGLLAPDGLVDDSLTVLVGIVGGALVGLIGMITLGVGTGSGVGLFPGLMVWLGVTTYLVRRRTVQTAIAHAAYAVGIVLLSIPLIALSPVVPVNGGLQDRFGLFLLLLMFVGVPAVVAVVVGRIAASFVPAAGTERDG